jgi:hypothetical protein
VVGLDLHAPAASVALLPAREIAVYIGGNQWEPGNHPFQDGHEPGPVRFTGGRKS